MDCERCGKPIEKSATEPRATFSLRKFCSRVCANKNQKRGRDIACRTCGKTRYWPASTLKRTNVNYCSIQCRAKYQRAQRVNEAEGTARCAKCKTWKPTEEFVRGRDAPHSWCKVCSSVWFHERRGTPEEKRRVYRPAYTLTDEEKKENKREWNRRQHHARRAGGERPSKEALDLQLASQDGRCAYCAVVLDAFHVDHKLPIARGGTNAMENLHFTCPRCNMRKGTMTHEEFLVSKSRPVRQWEAA